jgi:hypothetical protein
MGSLQAKPNFRHPHASVGLRQLSPGRAGSVQREFHIKPLVARPPCGARSRGELSGGDRVGVDLAVEHFDLQSHAMQAAMVLHPRVRHRLDDKVDVAGHRIQMRPKSDVHLLRMFEFANDRRRLLQYRTELCDLRLIQFSDARHVPLRLNDQRAHAKRADAMVNEPMAGLVDAAARRRLSANRITGGAFDHDRQSKRSGSPRRASAVKRSQASGRRRSGCRFTRPFDVAAVVRVRRSRFDVIESERLLLVPWSGD